jgi:DNA-binding transcriptional regulator YhcF (GntR family)
MHHETRDSNKSRSSPAYRIRIRISLHGHRIASLTAVAEFRQLHPALLRRALDTLVRKGKAQLLRGEGEVGDGVRFL